jgi:periplasmic protein CpxP/Spy
MTTQSKSKILITIIGILLIANIALVSFYFLTRPVAKKGLRADRAAMISTFLKNDLGFNQEQLKQYDSLSSQHRITIKAMFDEIRKEKENEFKQLTRDNFSDSSINNTATLFSAKQKEIEITMFKHFKDIRNICTPQQQPKFDSLFYKMLNKRNGERKK